MYCRPSKFSLGTLEASGSSLGLAPSNHLSQTGSQPLLKQLLEKKVIERPIFSLMLINGQEGVLSVGGTGAGAVKMAEQQTKDELDHAGAVERGEVLPVETHEDIAKRNEIYAKSISDSQKDWEGDWRWSKVQGAEGWWQILLQGVWVNGDRVLQNQGAVVDVRWLIRSCLFRLSSSFPTNSLIRSTAPSSLLLHLLLKLSMRPFPARVLSQPHTQISTPSLASTHRSFISNLVVQLSRSCKEVVVRKKERSQEESSV